MKKNRSKPASVADLRIPLMVCVLIGVFARGLHRRGFFYYAAALAVRHNPYSYIYISAIFTFLGVRNRLRRIAIEEERAAAFNTEIYQMFRRPSTCPMP